MPDEKHAPKKGLLIKMSQDQHTNFKILATKQQTDMTTIVLDLINAYIKKNQSK